MSAWTDFEFKALYEAWRESLETPLHERPKLSTSIFERFVVLCGGKTERTEGSVAFKQNTLKNTVQLIMGFQDTERWFSFTPAQKRLWFKQVNRKSYSFADVDVATFHIIEELVKFQYDSEVDTPSNIRISLRKNSDGSWGTQDDQLFAAPRPSSSVMSVMSSGPLPVPAGAKPISIVTTRPTQKSAILPQFIRPSNRDDDAIVLDVGSYSSDSSSESDSDSGMWDGDKPASLQRLHMHATRGAARSAPPLNSMRDGTSNAIAVQWNAWHPPVQSVPTAKARQKRSRARVLEASVDANTPSPAVNLQTKNERVDPELLMVTNILEQQAQQLKRMLARAKEERELDLQDRENDLRERKLHAEALQRIVDQLTVAKENRQEDHEQQTLDEAQKSKIVAQIKVNQEERMKRQEERRAEQEERRRILEQIKLDQEDRERDRRQRKVEQEERAKVMEQMKKDLEARRKDRAERSEWLEMIRLDHDARSGDRDERKQLLEKASRADTDAECGRRRGESKTLTMDEGTQANEETERTCEVLKVVQGDGTDSNVGKTSKDVVSAL